jgi:hypothetical protein
MTSTSRILALSLLSLSISALRPCGCPCLFALDSDGVVKGVVMDQSGAGDHDVTITVKSTVTGVTTTTKTRPDGTYRIAVRGDERYEIIADLRGFFRESYILTVFSRRETSVDFLLRAEPTHGYGDVVIVGQQPGDLYESGCIQGQVIGQFGRGISNAWILAKDEATGREYRAKAREDGTFLITNVREGRYDVKAAADNHEVEHLTAVIEYAVNAALKFDLVGW